MSFQLTCPNCGKRFVGEFTYGGEYSKRPSPADSFEAWADYVYMRRNPRGKEVEWWHHRAGCQRWFLVCRDTTCNTGHLSFWYDDREKSVLSS